MSDSGGGSSGTGAHRIGDAERDAATEALVTHREAGRLDAVEFEDRQVQVARARTWAEIQPLFADLPQPHPVGMPLAVAGSPPPFGHPVASDGPPASTVGQLPVPAQGLLGSVVPHRYKSTVMALTPFVALLLFFRAPGHTWLWFLAIPVMGILLYGPDGHEDRKRSEHRARDERRRLEREQRRLDRDRRRGR